MTETSSAPTTLPNPQPYPVTTSSLASPVVNGSLPDANIPEEEDYTIKCICDYSDDDGNTVFCDRCETWQHIECYYPGGDVPDLHLCAECDPRYLDGRKATERQKRLREQADGGDRKPKRPASKSNKKKTKQSSAPAESNGWPSHDGPDSALGGRDPPPPAKKSKSGHRASGSVNSLHGPPTAGEFRKRAFSNGQSYPSPVKSPPDHLLSSNIPLYTADFLELYDRDEGRDNVSADTKNYYILNTTIKLSEWSRDPHLLAEDARRLDIERAFIYADLPSAWPEVSLELKVDRDVEIDGRHPCWRLLRLQASVLKGQLVGEIKGVVGPFKEYCENDANRWEELRHPEPFVFFHPNMPIYIDSRKEGTKFRYVRRSCHPSLTLKTYVTGDGEYHYCFEALDDLQAGTELTAQWYMDRIKPDGKVDDPHTWASRLLANFGGCACDKAAACRMAALDCRRKLLDRATKGTGKKKRARNKQAISPLSTGQATNSRAGSENLKMPDEDDLADNLADNQSTSGSSRSKSRSRDMTPSHVASLDADPVLNATTLTARERRKIAMVEKRFERAEHDQAQRKKKRTSGGSTLTTPTTTSGHRLGPPSAASQPTTPSAATRPIYTDSGTSHRYSGSPPPFKTSTQRKPSSQSQAPSPSTPSVPSPFPRPNYVERSMQTEEDDDEPTDSPPLKRRKFTTPNQRLLRRMLEDRAKFQNFDRASSEQASPSSPRAPEVPLKREAEDVEMGDAPEAPLSRDSPAVGRSATDSPSAPMSAPVGQLGPPLPSQAAHSQRHVQASHGPPWKLSSAPPVPCPSHPAAVNASYPTPAASAAPSVAQSPFGFGGGAATYLGLPNSVVVAPSPAKKKLSLGDYLSRRSNRATTPSAEKTPGQALEAGANPPPLQENPDRAIKADGGAKVTPPSLLKPGESLKDKTATVGGVEGSAVCDTPVKEEPRQMPLSHTQPAPQAAPVPANHSTPSVRPLGSPPAISPALANVLSALNQMVPVSQPRSHSASSS